MSIQSQIDRLRIAIANAFTACSSKGATIPGNQTAENLSDCIKSIVIPTFKKQSKSYTPTKSSTTITPDSGYDGLSQVTVNAIPSNYIDTNGATANPYDIYNGKTAYVDGQLVTGVYDYQGHGADSQWNAGSSGCSETALVIPVPFTPTGCCVDLNSGTYNSNTIVSADFRLGDVATYHTYKGSFSGLTRSQYTSGISSYISYNESTKKLTIKSASSSYKWSTANYRVLVFR